MHASLPLATPLQRPGAGFFTDFMSKHAMHAGGAEEVLYAGGWVDGWVRGGRMGGWVVKRCN